MDRVCRAGGLALLQRFGFIGRRSWYLAFAAAILPVAHAQSISVPAAPQESSAPSPQPQEAPATDLPAPNASSTPDSSAQAAPTPASSAQAGSTPPSPEQQVEMGGIPEIVVTARYRKEKSQNVPIAMSALSGDDLETRGLTSAVDAARAMPNVVMAPLGQQTGQAIGMVIRGVGQTDSAPSLQPGVGYYVDDVYQGSLYGQQVGLLDIADIQVLRGPQGTLAGRNSEGGAVKIYTVKPHGDDSGYADIGYGSYAHERFRGAYDFSVVPGRVFLRVSAGLDAINGYMTRLDYGCENPASGMPVQTVAADCITGHEGGDNARALRARMRALVTDSLEINLSADVLDEKSEPTPSRKLEVETSLPDGSPTLSGLVAQQYPQLNYGPSWVTNGFYTNYDSFSSVFSGQRSSRYSNNPMDGLTVRSAAATVDWSIAGGMHLKSISGYRDYKGSFFATSTAPYGSLNAQYLKYNQYSQELQLTGAALNDRLDWTVGGFFFTSHGRTQGEQMLTGLNFDFAQDEPSTDLNKSAFAHINYKLTNELGLEAGVRYSQDDESYTFNRWLVTPFAGMPVGTPTVTPKRYSTGSARWDYKVGLSYQVARDAMVYGQVSTGYKAGGVNPRPTSDATVTTFKPEDLLTYELGAKTEWFHHKLRVNLAAFYSNYQNLQLSASSRDASGNLVVAFENVSRATIYGGEFEVVAHPTGPLSFDLSGGWEHYDAHDLGAAAYDPVNNTGGVMPGAPPPMAPSWKGGGGAQYTWPLGGSIGSLTLRADSTYQSRTYFDNQATIAASQAGYSLLNLALSWESVGGNWRATLRADNVLDREYYASKVNTLNPLGILSGTPGAPRMLLFTARRNFGGA